MNQTSTKYKRINKTVARKLYNEGKTIIIVGDNVNDYHFFDGWHLASQMNKGDVEYSPSVSEFDARVNNFEFYLEPELGRRAAFFIDK